MVKIKIVVRTEIYNLQVNFIFAIAFLLAEIVSQQEGRYTWVIVLQSEQNWSLLRMVDSDGVRRVPADDHTESGE